MFRSAIESGLGFVKRGLSSLKKGIFVGVRPASSVQNSVIPSKVANHEVPNLRNLFFAHWLQNASRVARFKCNPIQRMIGNRRNPNSLVLAFVGFSYLGATDAKNSAACSTKEEQLHTWLQKKLKRTAKNIPEKIENHSGRKLKDYRICKRLGKPSSNSAVYEAEADNNQYALKMLFNFYTNSQSVSLNRAFCKELAVLSNNKNVQIRKDVSRYTRLPNHFNVMKILWHFADDIPELPDAMDSYPYALPSRLYHDGYGRNRTLFFVMPKFSGTLQEYLAEHSEDLSTRKSLALLAQLLEALHHLNKNAVVHRDLKNDNVLVNENTRPDELPRLVLTDFDCCLAEKRLGLEMPYETDETRIWGNPELMAPEVACAEPGPGCKINYSKSDEWVAGALAYEIFGQKHPFQNLNVDKKSYHVNDLPKLKGAPKAVQLLVKQLLQRHPNDRPDISLAATVSQLLLWAPGLCDLSSEQSCSFEKVKRWYEEQIFSLMLEILGCKFQEDIPVEKQILSTFLCRTSFEEIMDAIKWLRDAFDDDMSSKACH